MYLELKNLLFCDPFVAKVDIGLAQALTHAGFKRNDHKASSAGQQALPLIIALSGGPDSVALLAALVALKEKLCLNLFACHVNHQLRAEESDKDEALCTDLCKTLAVPLIVKRAPGPAKERTKPSESSLRQIRYKLIEEAAIKTNTELICVAHTADDQAETQLFRLFRGTGPRGLLGMESARPIGQSGWILRPLLTIKRSECLSFLSRLHITARYDSSNADLSFSRNYIRHNLIPAIKQRFPNFATHLQQLKERISAEEALLSELTQNALIQLEDGHPDRFDLVRFQSLPTALKLRVIATSLEKRQIEVSFSRVLAVIDLIENIHLNRSKRLSLNARWDVCITQKQICWIDKISTSFTRRKFAGEELEVKIPGTTILLAFGQVLRVEVLSQLAPYEFPKANACEAIVDLSRVNLPLIARTRRPHDVIRPFGMDKLVRLKKYLHNQKIVNNENRRQVVLIADQDEILWVPGIGVSNKIRVTTQATHKLTWMPLATDKIYLC